LHHEGEPAIRTLGIVGGTFDPIHYGHLRLGAEVMAALGLSEVRMIPTGIPPHRPPPFASGADRLAMTELGCVEFPGLVADGREILRPGPSYTVVTLQALHAEDPTRPLALILGSDAFAGLAGWHRWEQLFTLAHFVVVERPGAASLPGAAPPALQEQWNRRLTTDPSRLARQLSGSIVRQAVTPQPISSSAIRTSLAKGASGRAEVRGLLPASVLAYIDRNQLYRPIPDAP
jgi:nicotinate-nucleotide adenylyltransferase